MHLIFQEDLLVQDFLWDLVWLALGDLVVLVVLGYLDFQDNHCLLLDQEIQEIREVQKFLAHPLHLDSQEVPAILGIQNPVILVRLSDQQAREFHLDQADLFHLEILVAQDDQNLPLVLVGLESQGSLEVHQVL